MLFNPSREQVRLFFCDAWRKHRERLPLAGADIAAAELAERHPEYHALLDDPKGALEQEWTPDGGQANPFLHLSLHLAIHEQLSIDQPPGIRAAFEHLARRLERHDAEHVLLEILAETIWHMQRHRKPFDAAAYIAEARRRAGLP